jgi:dephospho-CoA kinase
MLVVGLTGGIGSGKSAVSSMLSQYPEIAVIDTDLVAREVVEPGSKGLSMVADNFGSEVISFDKTLDRQRLGSIVFRDPKRLELLNSILHPLIFEVVTQRLSEIKQSSRYEIVLLVVPLLVETGLNRYPLDKVVVVDAPIATAIERLVRDRKMDRSEAIERISRQASREERLQVADYVVENSSTYSDLEEQVKVLYGWLKECANPKTSG